MDSSLNRSLVAPGAAGADQLNGFVEREILYKRTPSLWLLTTRQNERSPG
jgi:hypothetical protein